ncbi:hypothetical protein HDU82_006309 [Entophlyctis luteolus]|nr:hypothetical protein HDU82_006309 [Entophlyctis luteolus]
MDTDTKQPPPPPPPPPPLPPELVFEPAAGVYCAWDSARRVYVPCDPLPVRSVGVLRLVATDPAAVRGAHVDIDVNGALYIGRDVCSVFPLLRLRELAVSRTHVRIAAMRVLSADRREWHDRVYVADLGSTHGTFVDGQRVAEPKEIGRVVQVFHGTLLRVGSTSFEVHVHKEWPCASCSISSSASLQVHTSEPVKPLVATRSITPSAGAEPNHRTQSRQLRKELVGPYVPNNIVGNYVDRSQLRRELHGIDVSHISGLSELRQTNLVRKRHPFQTRQSKVGADSNSNGNNGDDEVDLCDEDYDGNRVSGIGEKMLVQLGWERGKSLGKRDDGIVEPVRAVANTGTVGLGFGERQ